jgi:hypothetical protein
MSHKPNELMTVTTLLAVLIAICNFVGLVLVVVSPLITDHFTKHQVQLPRRFVWIIPFLVGLFTYCSLTGWSLARKFLRPSWISKWLIKPRRNTRANSFRALLPVLAGGTIALIFKQDGGRAGPVVIMFAYGCLSMLTVSSRQSRETFHYINNPRLSFEGRLERLKATGGIWQQISVYSMAAYMGFVAVALTVFWAANVNRLMEDHSLGWYFVIHAGIYTFFVVVGPLHECFEMMFQAGRQLSLIQEIPRPAGNREEWRHKFYRTKQLEVHRSSGER